MYINLSAIVLSLLDPCKRYKTVPVCPWFRPAPETDTKDDPANDPHHCAEGQAPALHTSQQLLFVHHCCGGDTPSTSPRSCFYGSFSFQLRYLNCTFLPLVLNDKYHIRPHKKFLRITLLKSIVSFVKLYV